MRRLLPLLFMIAVHFAYAQSASDLANGTSFAKTLAPTSPSQIVNPSGVSSAWAGQTSTPSTVPAGLAGFSNPNTDSTLLSTARSGSLAAMGNQTMIDCASYVPGSDEYKNQDCAAVNFLNNQCMQATTGEQSVLGKTGTAHGTSANCAGTYGAGQSQFGYGNQVTPTDPMFTGTLNLGNTAGNVLSQTCSTSTVVTTPAQYANNTCIVSTDEEDNACSQYLNTTVTNTISQALSTQNCPDGGTLQGNVCVHTITYNPTISCPDGYIQNNVNQCVQYNQLQGTPYCPSGTTANYTNTGTMLCLAPQFSNGCPASYAGMPLEAIVFSLGGTCLGDYLPLQSCPNGYSWNGSACTQTNVVGTTMTCPSGGSLQGATCVSSSTTSSTTTYSCPSGQTLNGTGCIQKTVATSWTDTCVTYEKSAGVSLGVPQQ
ncbi:hypothetical protein [Paraburkholderia dioscoreae]|uniref:Conjugal transfer mating pair stabilization protein TraN n=1 Tax=Paraburkholderia dioscoreae TaxID=2604047 RepID=A0A5Q4ZKW0_9BURK|nr:hypothetical protein [Paraburkholderia dioscoreae]VVD30958.1 conserved exported protein of unknown function [Paraburkholderia dioscoreae]